MRKTLSIIIISFFSGILGAYTFHFHILDADEIKDQFLVNSEWQQEFTSHSMEPEPNETDFVARNQKILVNEDFVEASAKSTHSVVYIKNISAASYGNSWYDWFFGERVGQRISSGSGVIYTKDGYIITNNHVVQDADKIEVIHEKRTYEARIIGTDPSTDLALLKVDANNLPAVKLGSSRNLQVGEWVLAVGNPFNLTSTVTAGIVSAKGREINILKSDFPIESFIQTDAAINPGNSGGALVNRDGDLIGINTAILSKTGSYAGYGFAVPVDIVRKVADDMIEYGEVQKAFIGADVIDVNEKLAERLDIDQLNGVVINYIEKDGAADQAGLQKGDLIVALNNERIDGRSSFEEKLSYYSPGEKLTVTYRRNNKTENSTLILNNRIGTTSIITREIFHSKALGADIESIPSEEKEILEIKNGVRIRNIQSGFINKLNIQEGFVITKINNMEIRDPKDLETVLSSLKGRVIIEGINKQGVKGYYSYYF